LVARPKHLTDRIAVNAGIGYYDFDYNTPGSSSTDDNGAYISAGLSSEIIRIVVQPNLVIYDTDLADLWSVELNSYWKIKLGN
jgi:hypothetical protein